METCLALLSAAPHLESAITVVPTDPDLNVHQARFSPDQRRLAIQGVKYAGLSTIYAMPAGGGALKQITEGKHWDDKPCWGPDGRTICYVSDRGGFLNVWGLRFDPAKGTRVGEPFPVTTFESPRQMVFPRGTGNVRDPARQPSRRGRTLLAGQGRWFVVIPVNTGRSADCESARCQSHAADLQ